VMVSFMVHLWLTMLHGSWLIIVTGESLRHPGIETLD